MAGPGLSDYLLEGDDEWNKATPLSSPTLFKLLHTEAAAFLLLHIIVE